MVMEKEEVGAARQCVVCKKRDHNGNAFDLVCFCADNQGICHACFLLAGMDKKELAQVRDYGWQILGKNHAVQRRSSRSTDAMPLFESMMMSDPAVQRNIELFFAGRPMEPSAYASYVSPAIQAESKKKKENREWWVGVFYIFLLVSVTIAWLLYQQ
jgi:hypothetical protein